VHAAGNAPYKKRNHLMILQPDRILRGLSRIAITASVVIVIALAWYVATAKPYKPGSDFAYNLGLAGGVMMLTLLLYPLRKHFRFMSRAGKLSRWFRAHMMLGIAGPVLVLFHSTFAIGALNSRIAYYAMLLVVVSGLIGRFVYRHIHHGLYGSRTTLAEVEQQLKASANNMSTVFGLVPAIGEKLAAFQSYAFGKLNGVGARIWRFLTLRLRGRNVARAARREAWQAIEQACRAQNWPQDESLNQRRLVKAQIDEYVEAVSSAAMFVTWERLFSLWHIIHVPFIYLLVICGVIHVVAVNMY
jgi:hypothetical protein